MTCAGSLTMPNPNEPMMLLPDGRPVLDKIAALTGIERHRDQGASP